MRQLQIEFPDEFMRKYWLDSNAHETLAESEFCLEGRMRAYRKERGWHYTRKTKGPEQFPIEQHWVWYNPETLDNP
jgi:hypothetical protein